MTVFALNMTFKEIIHVVGGCIKYFLTKISYMPLGYLPIVTLSFVSYLVVCLCLLIVELDEETIWKQVRLELLRLVQRAILQSIQILEVVQSGIKAIVQMNVKM